MANTLKFGNGEWYGKKDTILAYNDENSNYKPLPFDFSRASKATVVNKDGLIEEVGSGQPRIDYKDNTKGALLLEPSRSNTITYSNDFLDSSWNVFRGSVTADVIISPDGTQNASRYEEDSQTGSHLFRRQSLSITNGLSYTGSIFIKKGELTSIILQSNSSSRWVASATFDVENGVVTSGTGEIEDYGNGWYRCSISGNAVQTTTAAGLEMYTSLGAGRDGDGLYMYGAMFEQGSYATSYIPTQGSAVTRAADSCNNGGNEQVINSTEGVLYAEIANIANDLTNKKISISDGTTSNSVLIFYTNVNNAIQCKVTVGGSASMNHYFSISDVTSFSKLALKWKANDFAIWLDGFEVHTDTSGGSFSAGTLTTVNFDRGDGGEDFYGKCKDLRVYNTALSDSELQALTS
jgi:hypothetical protein